MIPILYTFTSATPLARAVLYLLALALVAYAGWSGWRAAAVVDEGSKKSASQRRNDQAVRAVVYAALGAGLARFGLFYALPATAFLGGKGEGIPIHTYGILLATGFVSAVALAAHLAEREWRGEEGQLKRDQIFDLAFWVFLSGVGGSKLLFMIVNWSDYGPHLGEYFSSPEKLVELLGGGLVFYGGLIGATIAAYVYTRVHKFDFLRLADLAIPTVSLGQCLGRLGCFSAGCCWGDVGGRLLRWGVHFPGSGVARNLFGQPSGTASLAFQSQQVDGRYVIESTGQILHEFVPGAVRISEWAVRHGYTLPVHPTQLYESIGQFILFVTLMLARGSRRFHGQIFATWLMCYAVLRSTVELFRGDVERGTLHGLLGSLGMGSLADKVPLEAWYNISTSQFISICMFSLGATLLYRRGRGVLFRPTPGSAPAAA